MSEEDNRQRVYSVTFDEGGPGHAALQDLALFCHAFDTDVDGISHDQFLIMCGRRQAFFRIFKALNLSAEEMDMVARSTVVRRARGLLRYQQEGDA